MRLLLEIRVLLEDDVLIGKSFCPTSEIEQFYLNTTLGAPIEMVVLGETAEI